MKLFHEDLNHYVASAILSLRNKVDSVPCSYLESKLTELRAEADRYDLEQPFITIQPVNKSLSDDGLIATYSHSVSGGQTLRFKPNNYGFGGYLHSSEISGGTLTIDIFQADVNPEPRLRHQDTLNRLVENAEKLKQQLPAVRSQIVVALERFIAEKQKKCAEIDERKKYL